MVTARDGRPNPVTNSPLTAPSRAPSSRHSTMIRGSDVTPHTHSWPITEQVRPSTLATDRSISPVMTTSVIGMAISAIGMASSDTNRQNRGLATPSMARAPTTDTTTSAISTIASHEPNTRRARSGMGAPSSKAAAQPERQRAVQADGGQDQRPDRGLLPERVDAERGQRRADGGQQYGAERGPEDRAAATEDRHPAHDDGGDHVELGAVSGVGVEGAEAG